MSHPGFLAENAAARAELSDLIARLDEQSFNRAVGPGWTIATSLCHLAFWDQRALWSLREWERSGHVETSRLDPQAVESINQAVNAIAQAVPGPAAARLALDCASAVDSHLAGISEALLDQLVAAGLERYIRRALHRWEHLRKMREALDSPPSA